MRLYNPHSGHEVLAYGAFFSMSVKDPRFRATGDPVYNVDNYVYLALEIYYDEPGKGWADPPVALFEFIAPDPE